LKQGAIFINCAIFLFSNNLPRLFSRLFGTNFFNIDVANITFNPRVHKLNNISMSLNSIKNINFVDKFFKLAFTAKVDFFHSKEFVSHFVEYLEHLCKTAFPKFAKLIKLRLVILKKLWKK